MVSTDKAVKAARAKIEWRGAFKPHTSPYNFRDMGLKEQELFNNPGQ